MLPLPCLVLFLRRPLPIRTEETTATATTKKAASTTTEEGIQVRTIDRAEPHRICVRLVRIGMPKHPYKAPAMVVVPMEDLRNPTH